MLGNGDLHLLSNLTGLRSLSISGSHPQLLAHLARMRQLEEVTGDPQVLRSNSVAQQTGFTIARARNGRAVAFCSAPLEGLALPTTLTRLELGVGSRG